MADTILLNVFNFVCAPIKCTLGSHAPKCDDSLSWWRLWDRMDRNLFLIGSVL